MTMNLRPVGLACTVLLVASGLSGCLESDAKKAERTAADLTALQAQITQYYADKPDYGTTDMTAELVKAGIVPDGLRKGDSAMKHAWGGDVKISPSPKLGGYRITLDAIPTDGCVQLVSKVGGSSSGALKGVTVNDDGTPGDRYIGESAPIAMLQAIQLCSHKTNYIGFFYR